MNFFQAQQNARTSTFRLLALFGLAILCIVLITDLACYIAFGMAKSELGDSGANAIPEFDFTVFMIISSVVLIVIGIGSTWKYLVLSSGGGRVIAEAMGARLVLSSTNDLKEKTLMNVVEEMAIASGMPVPQVYILDDEDGINAFAAGLTTGDAVIGVTKGTVETLSRDELQGVIAHEYSHILNGDMSLNLQLIGILHGILILGIIGYYIVRSTSRSRSRDTAGLAIFGIALIVIGYGGTFFGNLIKASVSRQREFLADASAVQFTRNPEGIAGALKKIGGMSKRSMLDNENAPEMSHAYFAEGVSNYLGSLTATHPPLEDRIRRIEPRWDGEYITAALDEQVQQEEPETDPRPAKTREIFTSAVILQSVMQTMERMGNPGEEQIATARAIINAIPGEIRDAVHEPWGARAVIYCMVINKEDDISIRQLDYLKANADRGIHELCMKYLPAIDTIPRRCRLPLVDMAMPSLRELSESQYTRFRTNLGELVAADSSLDLFEWSLQKILYKHLDEAFFPEQPPAPKYGRFDDIKESCRTLFSVLAWAGQKEPADAGAAFLAAMDTVGLDGQTIIGKSDISLGAFDKGLDELSLLKPLLKETLLRACLACTMMDGKITARELELVRAIADTLNCPVPPVSTV